MPTIDEMRGVGPEEVEAQKEKNNKEEFDRVGGNEQSFQNQDEPTEDVKQKSKQVFSEQQTEEPTQDATQSDDVDLDDKDRNIKVLKNSFGIDFELLPEKVHENALKMAKSYRSAQGKFTQATQELSEKEKELQQKNKVLENLNGFLEQNPDIYEMIEKRKENPNAELKEPQGQPKKPASQGQLTEDQLAEAGYLNKSELQGMDELARRRKIENAKADYELDRMREQKIQNYKQELQKADEELQQQRQQKKVKQINEQRKNDGIDRFVSDYGVDLSELDKETINAVSRRASRILDPSDDKGRLIDEDAFYDALRKELAIRGNLPKGQQQPSQQKQPRLQDTGVSINKRQQQRTPNSVSDLMEQKEKERKSSLRNTHPRVAS